MTSASLTSGSRIALDVLLMVSFSHFLNDTVQSIIPASLPLLKENYALSFTEVGLITLTVQLTSSILQPLVGLSTDRRPRPYSLPVGMLATLLGILALSQAGSFAGILFAVALAGLGSAIFHPEGSKVVQAASGGRKGFAQSLFQVGGNAGFACGPLAAAFIVLPRGQSSIAWFALVALFAVLLLLRVSQLVVTRTRAGTMVLGHRRSGIEVDEKPLSKMKWVFALLFLLMFSKQIYISSLGNYLTFFVMEKFAVSMTVAQYTLFAFMGASAAGTLLGGPIGDRIGRRAVILWSILGAAPFAVALPWAPFAGVVALAVIVGFVISSAFSAILVYALELAPSRTGMISGLFFGFSFGLGGIASAAFGAMADWVGIERLFEFSAFLPLMGAVALALPKERTRA